jgi:hypothetical protein
MGVSLRLGPGAFNTDIELLRQEVEMYYSFRMQGKVYTDESAKPEPVEEESEPQPLNFGGSEEEEDTGVYEKQGVVEQHSEEVEIVY